MPPREEGRSAPQTKKKKGEKVMQNRYGSWNVDGQWAKGPVKIKYMETQDGMGLSRSRMRRERESLASIT